MWDAPGSASEVVFDKEPAELTRDDALTVAGPEAMFVFSLTRGT